MPIRIPQHERAIINDQGASLRLYDCSRITLLVARTIFAACALPALASSQVAVYTGGYGNARTNSNANERILNTSNVTPAQFGRLFSLPVDGQVYAQPLYVQGVEIPGKGAHNVVYAATMHNTVYAFDADAAMDPLWSVNLGPSVSASDYFEYTDISPEIGILGTPVIDGQTGTLYLVANTKENGRYLFRLHALDIVTGQEKYNAAVVVAATVPGSGDASKGGKVGFDAAQHLQRPALLLLDGVVYVGFGSHADQAPYHGWLFGYSAADVQSQTAVLNVSPDGSGASIWQGGRGPAADENGFIYVSPANGDWNGKNNWGQSFLKLDPRQGLSVSDWFTPADWSELNNGDSDVGSAGAALVPGTNLLVGGDKSGYIYVMDRNAMGHMSAGDTGVYQRIHPMGAGVFNLAIWNAPDGPVIYLHAWNDIIHTIQLTDGQFQSSASVSASATASAFNGMSVSSNDNDPASAILWFTTTAGGGPVFAGMLHAFAAADLSRELWKSDLRDRDKLGLFAKFANPTVANGKVYVPTFSNRLVVYGLLPSPGVHTVVNAASLMERAIAPGEIVIVAGDRVGPASAQSAAFDDTGALAATVGNTRILFDGDPGAILSVGPDRASVVVPMSVSGKAEVSVHSEVDGQLSEPFQMAVRATDPGLFTQDSTGSGPGAFLNENGTVNSPDHPASPGSIVVLYATGGGMTEPLGDTFRPAQAPYPRMVAPVAVTIGGENADVIYAGPAPLYAGLVQLNVRVPSTIAPGAAVPVELKIGDVSTGTAVTISIR